MSNKLMYRLGLEELVEDQPIENVDTDGSDSVEAHMIDAEETANQADSAVEDNENLVEDAGTLEDVVVAMNSALASGNITRDTITFSRTPVAGVYRRWGMDLPPVVSTEGMSDYNLTAELTASMEGIKENLAKFYQGMVARIKQARDHIMAFITPAKKAVGKLRERAHALKAHVEAAGSFAGGEDIAFSNAALAAGGQAASGGTLVTKLKELETFTIHAVGPDGSGCLKTVESVFLKLADDVVGLKDAEKYNQMLNRTGEEITKAIGDYVTQGLPKIHEERDDANFTNTYYSNALLGGKSIEVTNFNYKSLAGKIGTSAGKGIAVAVGSILMGTAAGAIQGAGVGGTLGAYMGAAGGVGHAVGSGVKQGTHIAIQAGLGSLGGLGVGALGGALLGGAAGALDGTIAHGVSGVMSAFCGFPASYLANHVKMRTRKAPMPKKSVFQSLSSKDALAALTHVVAICDAIEVFFREAGARDTAVSAAEAKIDHHIKALQGETGWYRRRFLASIGTGMVTVYNKLDNYNVQICSTNLGVCRAVLAYVVASVPTVAAAQ
jgi:hypothetical protein